MLPLRMPRNDAAFIKHAFMHGMTGWTTVLLLAAAVDGNCVLA